MNCNSDFDKCIFVTLYMLVGDLNTRAWSDTPPICFEHGGCVVNMAVTLDGEHPIGANARRIAVFFEAM